MTPWSPPISAILYGSLLLALAFGFLFFGGASRLRQLFQPPSSANPPTLQIPLPPFLLRHFCHLYDRIFLPAAPPRNRNRCRLSFFSPYLVKNPSLFGDFIVQPPSKTSLLHSELFLPFFCRFFFFSSSAPVSFSFSAFPSNPNPR